MTPAERDGRKWTDVDVAFVIDRTNQGMTPAEVGQAVGRSTRSIEELIRKLQKGVKPYPPGVVSLRPKAIPPPAKPKTLEQKNFGQQYGQLMEAVCQVGSMVSQMGQLIRVLVAVDIAEGRIQPQDLNEVNPPHVAQSVMGLAERIRTRRPPLLAGGSATGQSQGTDRKGTEHEDSGSVESP